jgi:hypothetical protein
MSSWGVGNNCGSVVGNRWQGCGATFDEDRLGVAQTAASGGLRLSVSSNSILFPLARGTPRFVRQGVPEKTSPSSPPCQGGEILFKGGEKKGE